MTALMAGFALAGVALTYVVVFLSGATQRLIRLIDQPCQRRRLARMHHGCGRRIGIGRFQGQHSVHALAAGYPASQAVAGQLWGLLRTVARRLLLAVRGEDTVSRLGGDEFVIVMRNVGSREELDALVHQRLIPAVRAPIVVEGHSLHVSCSVGGALFPEDALAQDELMRCADAAMYEAKAAGRDTARYFSVETDQRISARQALEAQLRTAVAQGEFKAIDLTATCLRSHEDVTPQHYDSGFSVLEAPEEYRHLINALLQYFSFYPLQASV